MEESSAVSEQDNKQPSLPRRPTTNKRDDWHNYWNELGQPWRTEPEIDGPRQEELTDLRLTLRDIDGTDEDSFYVFGKDIELTRADIEWLLATHEQEQRIIDQSDKSLQPYKGLDLRGVDLHGKNLRGLHMKGINFHKANLEGADLSEAHLEEANLSGAILNRAILNRAHLEKAYLDGACFEQAQLTGTHLEGVSGDLNPTNIRRALLKTAHLEGASFLWVDMERSLFSEAHLEGAYLSGVNLMGASLAESHLEGADLSDAHLEGASLKKAYLHGANLSNAHLEGANLNEAHLEGKSITDEYHQEMQKWCKNFQKELLPANLSGAFFDNKTNLKDAIFGDAQFGAISLADTHLDDVSLSVVDWKPVKELGDERKASELRKKNENEKVSKDEIDAYETATRANRQLAVSLQNQGLNEKAAYFAYRAQNNQRHLLKLDVLFGLEHMSILCFLIYKPKGLLSKAKPVLLTSIPLLMLITLYYSLESIRATSTLRNSLEAQALQTLLFDLALVFSYLLLYRISFRILVVFIIILIFYLLPLILLFFLLNYLISHITLFITSFLIIILFIYSFILLLLLFNSIPLFIAYYETRRSDSAHIILIRILRKTHSKFDEVKTIVMNNTKKVFQTFSSHNHPFIRVQISYGQYIFSLFLNLLAGYGYKPMRSVVAYLLIIVTFASLYYTFGQGLPVPITTLGALVLSLTSFHGRGFFPGLNTNAIPIDHPLIVLAAVEAVIGLIIEISFIATFTQRYFGK